jgi:hypothetical protein
LQDGKVFFFSTLLDRSGIAMWLGHGHYNLLPTDYTKGSVVLSYVVLPATNLEETGSNLVAPTTSQDYLIHPRLKVYDTEKLSRQLGLPLE